MGWLAWAAVSYWVASGVLVQGLLGWLPVRVGRTGAAAFDRREQRAENLRWAADVAAGYVLGPVAILVALRRSSR